MSTTIFHRLFSPLKKLLPHSAVNFIRSIGTALIGPIQRAYLSGYYRSTFKMAPVDRHGQPIPWYTYPAIDFLKYRDYADRLILEFGGGHSTLWWAERAEHVVSFEGDQDWYQEIHGSMPDNVNLFYVSTENKANNIKLINDSLTNLPYSKYDVVIIDEVADFARSLRGKMPLAIATGGSRLIAEKTLQAVGLSDLFDEVVTANDVVCGKPAPDIYLEVASRLEIAPERCLVFEDAPAGMMAAQSAGMTVVCVPAPLRVI